MLSEQQLQLHEVAKESESATIYLDSCYCPCFCFRVLSSSSSSWFHSLSSPDENYDTETPNDNSPVLIDLQIPSIDGLALVAYLRRWSNLVLICSQRD